MAYTSEEGRALLETFAPELLQDKLVCVHCKTEIVIEDEEWRRFAHGFKPEVRYHPACLEEVMRPSAEQ